MPVLPSSDEINRNIQHALSEDLNQQTDLTALLIDQERINEAQIITRQAAIFCGQAWVTQCFRTLDPDCQITWHIKDGDALQPDQTLCHIQGRTRALLTAERTALNFAQTLSATATRTHEYVQAISGTQAKILDTRKTLPGLRLAQKYAVATGGGCNQRIGLFDGILIKENHISAAGSIQAALHNARQISNNRVPIQIEVETLSELQQALDADARLILLDNFSVTQLTRAVAMNDGHAELEASGGITLNNVKAVAQTGVHRISIGALTKDIQAIDLSMSLLS